MRFRLAALSLLCAPALAADGPLWDRELLAFADWGIICAPIPLHSADAPDTVTGYIETYEGEATVGLRTTRVPARLGVGFGVIARSRSQDGIDGVRITVTHPPIRLSGTTQQGWAATIPPTAGAANFYRLDDPDEVLPGLWQLTADIDGRILYAVTFDLVDPALMPDFTLPCPGPPLVN